MKFKKTLSILFVVQGVCVAIGLWMYAEYAVTAAEWDVANRGVPLEVEHLLSALPAAGAVAFFWIVSLQGVMTYVLVGRREREHREQLQESEQRSLNRTRELIRTRDSIVFGLAKLAESRDRDTGHHLDRISLYCTRMASAMRRHPKYAKEITAAYIRRIGISSALHDIGKVGISDNILLKPGPLTEEQREMMQHHTIAGAQCIEAIERRLASSNFLTMAREIALSHHERWDGHGYPHGLKGSAIPLAARIVAIADVYDALAMKRCYKDRIPHDVCVEQIREAAGSHFDPDLVEVFLEIAPQFREIAERFSDAIGDVPHHNHELEFELPKMSRNEENVLLRVAETDPDLDDLRLPACS